MKRMGLYDLFDDALTSALNMTVDELELAFSNMSEEKGALIIDGVFSDKKDKIEQCKRIMHYYKNK